MNSDSAYTVYTIHYVFRNVNNVNVIVNNVNSVSTLMLMLRANADNSSQLINHNNLKIKRHKTGYPTIAYNSEAPQPCNVIRKQTKPFQGLRNTSVLMLLA